MFSPLQDLLCLTGTGDQRLHGDDGGVGGDGDSVLLCRVSTLRVGDFGAAAHVKSPLTIVGRVC